MKFELVKKTERQRFYKSDVAIKKFPYKSFDWEKEITLSRSRLKQGIELIDDECFYVCVSDAHTHTERLVFACGRYVDDVGVEDIAPYSMLHIAGAMTMMIHGGDSNSVRADEVYLRQISILNSK